MGACTLVSLTRAEGEFTPEKTEKDGDNEGGEGGEGGEGDEDNECEDKGEAEEARLTVEKLQGLVGGRCRANLCKLDLLQPQDRERLHVRRSKRHDWLRRPLKGRAAVAASPNLRTNLRTFT